MNDDELLGALGDALEPPEREVPAARLDALRALAVEHGTAPPGTTPSTTAPPHASRRTVLVGSIAAAIGAAAGVAATVAATGDDGSAEVAAPPTGPFEVTTLTPGATAEARTIDHTWGMELLLDIEGLPLERTYSVTFATAAGPVSAGGFRSVGVLMRCRFNATALRSEVTDVTVADDETGEIVLLGRPA